MELLILSGLFVLGVIVGTQLNRGIYRLAWVPRAIGPWSAPHADAPTRHGFDRIPLVGWIGLRRESTIHGRGFWIRPLLIELATGGCFAGLYWYEVLHAAVVHLPQGLPVIDGLTNPLAMDVLCAQYFSHIILFSLLLVVTFIDFDEQTIPDAITTPGTIIGLILAAAWPLARPITIVPPPGLTAPLHVVSGSRFATGGWVEWLQSESSLAIGLACFAAWWVAVVPWSWITRRGLRKAVQYFCASFARRLSVWMFATLFVGLAAIVLVWGLANPAVATANHRWESLFSSLVGMAAGGALIWAVRIIGSRALGQEAMGFGDVTLMAMIGAFLGWQSTLIIFFLAPFAALIISVTQWLLTRRRDIAFGPYLCLATCYLIVDWGDMWERSRPIFSLGMFVPAVLAVGLALMGIMLIGMRWLRETFTAEEPDADADRAGNSVPAPRVAADTPDEPAAGDTKRDTPDRVPPLAD